MRTILLGLIAPAFIALLMCACRGGAQNGSGELSSPDTLLGKHVVFPNSLFLLQDGGFIPVDEVLPSIEGKTKIVSIVDGTCMKCIVTNMNVLDSLFHTIILDSDQQMVFILNVSSADSAHFMRNLQPAISVQGMVLWDNSFNFETVNALFTPNLSLRTFMLSPSDSIVMYGNPLINPDLLHGYMANLGY